MLRFVYKLSCKTLAVLSVGLLTLTFNPTLSWAQPSIVGDTDDGAGTIPGDTRSDVVSLQSVKLDNPLGEGTTLVDFLNTILDVVLIFAVPIIVFFIILAGFQYVMARGNPDKISQASKSLLYALIGGVLIIGAKVLLEVISGTVNSF